MKSWLLEHIFNQPISPRRIEYLTLDEDLKILETSSAVQQFAEFPQEIIKGKDVRLAFPEFIGVEEVLSAILAGQENRFELKGIKRFSEPNPPFYIDIYAFKDNNENFLENKVVILFEEATERMLLEQELQQTIRETSLLSSTLSAYKDFIEQIIAAITDALLVTTASGYIKKVNKAAQQLFGYEESELIKQPISLIITDPQFLHKSPQQLTLNQSVPFKDVKVVCQTKTGTKITVLLSCSTIQTDIEELQNFVYIGRTLTESQAENEY